MTEESKIVWKPELIVQNYRVEVGMENAMSSFCSNPKSKRDAAWLADYINQLKGIKAFVYPNDYYYKCPSCGATAPTLNELKGCCEVSLPEEKSPKGE